MKKYLKPQTEISSLEVVLMAPPGVTSPGGGGKPNPVVKFGEAIE